MAKQISVSDDVYMYLEDKKGEMSFNEVIAACVSKGGSEPAFIESVHHLEALIRFFIPEPLLTEMLKECATLKAQFHKGA